MNKFTGSGTLPRAAIVNGTEKKALRFTLACVFGYDSKRKRDLVSYVPCVMFEPTPETEKLLAQEWKGLFFEVEGHVTTSKYESNGDIKYSTQVIVNRNGIRLVSEIVPYFSKAAAARDTERKAA